MIPPSICRFLLEIYEKDVILTENRRGLVPEIGPPLPITLDEPVIPDFPEDPPDWNEIVQQASDTFLPPIEQPLPPISPQISQPMQPQRSQPIPVPIAKPDYSSHELSDVLFKAQYLKPKNLI